MYYCSLKITCKHVLKTIPNFTLRTCLKLITLDPLHREGTGGATVGGDGPGEDGLVVAKVLYAVVSRGRGGRDAPRDGGQALPQQLAGVVPLEAAQGIEGVKI